MKQNNHRCFAVQFLMNGHTNNHRNINEYREVNENKNEK